MPCRLSENYPQSALLMSSNRQEEMTADAGLVGGQRQSRPDFAPESWVNPRDASLLRLIPAGDFIMGSTREQIEAAGRMDPWGHPDLLLHEMPQFHAFVPDFYMGCLCTICGRRLASASYRVKSCDPRRHMPTLATESVSLRTSMRQLSGVREHPLHRDSLCLRHATRNKMTRVLL